MIKMCLGTESIIVCFHPRTVTLSTQLVAITCIDLMWFRQKGDAATDF